MADELCSFNSCPSHLLKLGPGKRPRRPGHHRPLSLPVAQTKGRPPYPWGLLLKPSFSDAFGTSLSPVLFLYPFIGPSAPAKPLDAFLFQSRPHFVFSHSLLSSAALTSAALQAHVSSPDLRPEPLD